MSTSDPYPSYPGDSTPGTSAGPPQAPQQPPSIKTAVTLMRVGAVISLLGVVYTLLSLNSFEDDIKRQALDSDTSLTASELDSIFAVTVAVVVILGILGALLWLWMAWANGRGRKWARRVATVLGALNIVSSMLTLANNQATTITTILTIVNLAVGAGALYFLYRPDSSRFYEESSRPAY